MVDIKCRCYSGEMSAGYIDNGSQPVQWIPVGKKPSMFAFSGATDGVNLKNTFSMFKTGGYTAEAYDCARCCMIIDPTE